jgi:hypothetical protein
MLLVRFRLVQAMPDPPILWLTCVNFGCEKSFIANVVGLRDATRLDLLHAALSDQVCSHLLRNIQSHCEVDLRYH